MNPDLSRALYECPVVVALGPVWSALLVGFVVLDWWGCVHLTAAGEAYLRERGGE